MSSPQKAMLLVFLGAACGGTSGHAPITTEITTVGLTNGSSTGSSSGGSTTSSSSSGGLAESSSAISTSAGSSSPDLPDFETLGPAQGCGKIDVLFVVADGGETGTPEGEKEATKDAKAVRDSTNGFIAALQEQAADYDLQVMVVKGDPEFPATQGPEDCCTEEKLCDVLGTYPCDINQVEFTKCDSALGAGVRYPTGFMASNRDCALAEGRRYITEAQEDFPTAFDCVINVGRSGAKQPYLGAMVKAVGPTLNAPDGCNAGFLRPDAMLVVVILAASWDETPTGTPEGFAASLIAAKDGYVDGIVVVGVLRSVDDHVQSQCGDAPDDVARKMVEQFPNHVLGSYCVPDMGVHLSKALDVIDAACERFTPPG